MGGWGGMMGGGEGARLSDCAHHVFVGLSVTSEDCVGGSGSGSL